jgi:hypothetical protein
MGILTDDMRRMVDGDFRTAIGAALDGASAGEPARCGAARAIWPSAPPKRGSPVGEGEPARSSRGVSLSYTPPRSNQPPAKRDPSATPAVIVEGRPVPHLTLFKATPFAGTAGAVIDIAQLRFLYDEASVDLEDERQFARNPGCAYRLCHPNVVPMETAEPSD